MTTRRDQSVERLLQRSLAGGDSSPASACPDSETLAAWVDGGLGPHDVALVEAHASNCARCQALLAAVVQADPAASSPASQKRWWHAWGPWSIRWLVPLAAGAAAVILWVAVPNDDGPNLPEQARAQLPNASPGAARPEPGAERFNAPAVAAEPPAAASATGAAKADESTASIGPPERELRKDNAESQGQEARGQDALGALARAGPSAADAARSQSSLNETVALSRRGASGAPLEITSSDPSVRWRIGAAGSVEYTSNGGTTWEAVPTGASAELTAGASPSRLVCWLVGRAGTVLLSTDGRTWRRLAFPEMADLAAVQAVDARTATITTSDGRMFRTTDGGLTWN